MTDADKVALAVKMRLAQKAYFRTRTKDNLIAAKEAETAFDRACVEEYKREDQRQ